MNTVPFASPSRNSRPFDHLIEIIKELAWSNADWERRAASDSQAHECRSNNQFRMWYENLKIPSRCRHPLLCSKNFSFWCFPLTFFSQKPPAVFSEIPVPPSGTW